MMTDTLGRLLRPRHFQVYIQDLTQGLGKEKKKRILEGYGEWTNTMVFSPDCKFIAASYNNKLRLWNSHNGRTKLERCCESEAGPSLIACSPDSLLLAWGFEESKIEIWITSRLVRVHEIDTSRSDRFEFGVKGVSFSPMGETLLSACGQHIQLWDMREPLPDALPLGPIIPHLGFAKRSIVPDAKISMSSDYKAVAAAFKSTAPSWQKRDFFVDNSIIEKTFVTFDANNLFVLESLTFSHDCSLAVSAFRGLIQVWPTSGTANRQIHR